MDMNKKPTLAMSDMFFNAFAKLPSPIRKKVQAFLMKFRLQATSTGINYEKIHDAATPDYRSARIDDNYRAIISHPKQGNVYLLLWVDTHEEAYRWARTHVCNINPATGSLQVYESMQTFAVAPQAAPLKETANPVFELISDEDLASIGLPEECLSAVRKVRSREELESLRSHLPLEVFESLVWLADGETIEDVRQAYGETKQTDDFEEALKNTRSQRTFRVIESDEEMQKMVDASLECWRVFLHPLQRKLVESTTDKPMIVRGAAGTGKTVVAMHRAVHLVKQPHFNPNHKVLFTTYTKNLAIDIDAQLDLLCTADEKSRIEVVNLDAWVANFLKRNKVEKTITYPGRPDYDRCWSAALTSMDLKLGLPETFYDEEWRRIILPNEIMTEQEYLRAPRRGRGTPLSRKQRKAIWPVFDDMRTQMSNERIMTIEDACFMATHILKTQAGITQYHAVIVDETQDFGNEALTLLAQLARPFGDEKNDPNIFMVGDGQQRIYARQGSLSSCGINVRGRRSARLKLTYRTTEEIRRVANAVLQGVSFDDMDESSETLQGGLSNRHGERPETYVADCFKAECDWIEQRIKDVKESFNIGLNDICIVTRTKNSVAEYQNEFSRRGYAVVALSRKSHDDASISGLRFATMHRVKGLEFKVVFIVNASAGQMPLEISDTEDAQEQHINELTERSLFYVAASRAKDALFVSCNGEPGSFIKAII